MAKKTPALSASPAVSHPLVALTAVVGGAGEHPVPNTPSEVNIEPAPAAVADAGNPPSDLDPAFPEPQIGELVAGAPMQVKIKPLSDRAKTPTYGSAGAACFDLYAADTLAVAPGRSAAVPTDLAFEVPDGYALMIYSRSGHGFKHGVRLANNTGVVDSDYRGHVPVCLHNDGREVFFVRQGDRVAQAMIIPVPRVEFEVVDELSSTERGENGFGSTGR